MAMTDCKECGKKISTEAESCPHCGAKPPKPTSRLAIFISGIFLIGILHSVFQDEQPTAAKPPPNPQAELEFQQAVGALNMLKSAMKNPASFELVSIDRVQGPALCIVYRGTNSFNAIITSQHVISDTVNSSKADAWNSHCAGRSGTSFMHARHAMR